MANSSHRPHAFGGADLKLLVPTAYPLNVTFVREKCIRLAFEASLKVLVIWSLTPGILQTLPFSSRIIARVTICH